MRLENNSKFGRGRKRAREVIEREYLAVYSVERICLDQAHCEYELHVPYRDHTELEHLVMALWKAMGSAADDHDCFIDEVEFTDKATGRCW